MTRARAHSFDGRFTVMLDEDDTEIVKLMLDDKPRMDVMHELKAGGMDIERAVSLVREAESDLKADADRRTTEGAK